jgi:hypothetical protein
MKNIFLLSVLIIFSFNVSNGQTLNSFPEEETATINKNPFASPLQIIPNPEKDKFTLLLPPSMNNFTLQIFSYSGKLVYEKEVKGKNEIEVPTDNFVKGSYQIFVENNQESFMEKLVIK